MARPETTDAVERVVHIDARPETIFQFLVDPVKIVKWKGISADVDPRPGGIYRVDLTGGNIARGEYVEVTPFTRVVFTWGWEGEGSPLPPGTSTVEVTLIPDGDGTLVRLRHYGLPTPEQQASHAAGWDHFLERLAAVASGQDPGPDPWNKSE